MQLKVQHLSWFIAATLLFCSGCPSASNSSTNNSTAVPLDTALAQTTNLSVLASSAGPSCVQIGLPASTIHRQMLDQLNAYRVENGLQPLVYSKTLETAANAHVKDLYDRNFFDHINPDGRNPGDRAIAAGFCHKYVGENIAAGQTSVTSVMTAWKNSPHHNENMLTADYVYVGMGHYIDPNGRQYWGQEFAFDVPTAVASSQ